jgi:hypothetical protein
MASEEAGMSRFVAQRVAVLVDTAYVYRAARRLFRGADRLSEVVGWHRAGAGGGAGDRVCRAAGDADVEAFVEALAGVGFEVRVRPGPKAVEGLRGAWDVGLALTAVALAGRVDVVAVVAGSGDLVDLFDHLEVSGVRAELYAFGEAVDEDLALQADAFHALGAELLFDSAP